MCCLQKKEWQHWTDRNKMNSSVLSFLNIIVTDLDCADKYECLKKASQRLSGVANISADEIFSLLKLREMLGSTALGNAFALPHAKTDKLSKLIGGLFITKKPVDFESLDGLQTQIFFVILAPSIKPSIQLKALTKVAKIFKSNDVKEKILKCRTPDDIKNIIKDAESKIQSYV